MYYNNAYHAHEEIRDLLYFGRCATTREAVIMFIGRIQAHSPIDKMAYFSLMLYFFHLYIQASCAVCGGRQ